MISNSSNQGNKEAIRIIRNDLYKIRQYKQDYFDFIIDIGANIGAFSILMRMLHPNTKIYAFEPSTETFGYLKQNVNMLDIDVFQIALGNGEKLYFKSQQDDLVATLFVDDPKALTYPIESLTLEGIFSKLNLDINKKYYLKIDCEGGEKFLINDKKSEDIIQNSIQTGLEIHFKSPVKNGDFWLDYNTYYIWINKRFGITHKIEYYDSRKKSGYGNYCLTKKTI